MIVGVVGPSYSGSTVLNYLLGTPARVTAVGEAHWIIDRAQLAGRSRLTCLDHDEACDLFTAEVLAEMASAPPDGWYRRLAQRIGAEVMVTTDKHPEIYQRLGLPDVAVLVYKDPRAQLASLARHEGGDPLEYVGEVVRIYEAALEWRGPGLAVCMEDLIDRPMVILSQLERALGVPYDGHALRFWESKRGHNMGGNFSTRTHQDPSDRDARWRASFHRRLAKDERWRVELPPRVAQAILDNLDVRRVYWELARRSRELA